MQKGAQAANAVVMIRPHRFFSNPETLADNVFQRETMIRDSGNISRTALAEFDRAVELLRSAGVTVEAFDDTPSPEKPDAIFPNNWFSTHEDGRVVLYPMYSPTRRRERRVDIIGALRKKYRVTQVIDYSKYEEGGRFLEGTGSLVLDRPNRLAYVSLSKRSDSELVERFCKDFEYDAVVFESASSDGRPIYHTNVMLCVGSAFALVGLDTITDASSRDKVRASLETTNKAVIELSRDQIENFAGNALEVSGNDGSVLILSERAAVALRAVQRAIIEKTARLLPLSLPTIEFAGGSARCMLAEIFLPPL
jgi:hypothetical protein